MPSPSYIVRHGTSGWKYKREVPPDLRAHFRGRRSWIKTLGSIPRDEAIKQARRLAVEHDDLIDHLRNLTPEDAALVQKAGGIERVREMAQVNYWERDAEKMEAIGAVIEQMPLTAFGPLVTKEQAAIMIVNHKQRLKPLREYGSRMRAVSGIRLEDPLGLQALIPTWKRVSPRLTDKVVKRMGLYVRRFHDVVGKLHPKQVTRAHMLRFRDKMEETQSRVNAIKHLEAMHALFGAAVKVGELGENPAHNVKVLSKADRQKAGKQPFQPHHVRAIFAAMKKESADFQLLVKILAYHGLRSGEAAQLRPEDVTVSMGVPVLRIHGEHGSVKNAASRRDVPLHPKIRKEVEAYAKAAKGEWLFASFPVWQAGRAAWFHRYASLWLRNEAGIKDPNLTMHSFRHMFRTLAREVEMPEAVSRALMGHTLGEGEHGKYGTAPSLAKRAEWIARIDPLAGAAAP